MKIIDILINSAQLLGLTKEIEVLETATEETESEIFQEHSNIASLFNLIKFSIRELCTNYAPMEAKKPITTTNKMFPVGDFENFIRVHNVMKHEQIVRYKILNRNIVVEEDGDYIVTYASYPTILTIFEEIDFLQNFSPDVITFGLCAYYSLAHGMFNEFEEFHEQYVERAESLKCLKILELPSRRWE